MTENFCIFSFIFLDIPHKICCFSVISAPVCEPFITQQPVKTDKIAKNAKNIHPPQNDTWVVPPQSSTNFLPLLSGSRSSRNS